jgi:hypothetical protein
VFQMTLPHKTSYVAPLALPVAYADGGDIRVSIVGFDIDDPFVEEQLRAIAEAGGGDFLSASNLDELNSALKQATGSGGLSTALLVLGGAAACVLPLLLLLVIILFFAGRRRRVPVAGPVGYSYGAQPFYPQAMPPVQPVSSQMPPQVVPRTGELALLRGQAQPPQISLSTQAVRLGRSQRGNHVTIADPMVSGTHAEIYAQGNAYWVQDLRSTNGTYVNGVRIAQPQCLREGDHLVIGNTEWVFRYVGGTMMMPR